jgi:ABC-type multidrug transport system ATPase subunit
VRALHNVSLNVAPGMFGLLGPNGAGKSTLLRTIATLQLPDAGTIRLDDLDVLSQPDQLRKVLGYLPQEFGLYPNLSGETVLDHFAALKGVADKGERRDLVHSLLQQANLWDARAKSVGGYSGGMKQRLGIAIALAGRPKLLIVDEPTAGLDPTERHRFLNLLADIGDDVIVMLSTHIVEDVRELCRRMAIINGGEVILQGDPDVVLDELRGRMWRKRIRRAELDELRARLSVISVRLVAGEPVINVVSDSAPDPGFTAVDPVLEDVYFHRVGSAALAE